MVFKLDFSKAFDSVSWELIAYLLQHRSFPPKFRSWLHNILHTEKTRYPTQWSSREMDN